MDLSELLAKALEVGIPSATAHDILETEGAIELSRVIEQVLKAKESDHRNPTLAG